MPVETEAKGGDVVLQNLKLLLLGMLIGHGICGIVMWIYFSLATKGF